MLILLLLEEQIAHGTMKTPTEYSELLIVEIKRKVSLELVDYACFCCLVSEERREGYCPCHESRQENEEFFHYRGCFHSIADKFILRAVMIS
jgi:hypothetical protein